MARSSYQTLTRPPLLPWTLAAASSASRVFRKAAAVLLLNAAVALPCAVLYRAALPTMLPSVQVAWDPRPWWECDPPRPLVMVPEEDGGLDPMVAGNLGSEDLKLEQVLLEASMDNKTIILTTLNAAWASPGSEKRFLTAGYMKMMWKRLDFLQLVLEKVTASFSRMQTPCGSAIHFHISILMEIFRLHVITT